MELFKEMVSVVIPYYNRQDCIIPCLESVLAQTYSNLEVIIVDDGSKESAEELLKPYLGERIRYHRYTPNQGVSHARNVGVSIARGEYIAFQDSDDLWHPDKLERQLDYLRSGGWDFVLCGMNRVHTLNGTSSYYPPKPFNEHENPVEQLLRFGCGGGPLFLLTYKMAQKIAFDENLRKFEDGDYLLQAALSGAKIGYLPIALLDSEVHPDSLTVLVGGGSAREKIYQKYLSEYEKYPASQARALDDIARCYRKTDRKKAVHYQYLSLTKHFTPKCFVKYLLTLVGILK